MDCRTPIAQRIVPKEGFKGFVTLPYGAMPFRYCALLGLSPITQGSDQHRHSEQSEESSWFCRVVQTSFAHRFDGLVVCKLNRFAHPTLLIKMVERYPDTVERLAVI